MVLAGVVALVSGMVVAQPAAAAGEVHFDPDSPAGKEYALPLDRARDEAIGDVADGEPGERAPLFGVGISAQDESGQAPGIDGGRGKQQATEGDEIQGNGIPGSGIGRVASLSATDDGYPLVRGVGMVAAIVLLGGVLALALRRAGQTRRI